MSERLPPNKNPDWVFVLVGASILILASQILPRLAILFLQSFR